MQDRSNPLRVPDFPDIEKGAKAWFLQLRIAVWGRQVGRTMKGCVHVGCMGWCGGMSHGLETVKTESGSHSGSEEEGTLRTAKMNLEWIGWWIVALLFLLLL